MTISKITLENFKCFDALEFPCAPLTLLTGYNAAGKSTVLQSLLLLTQGLREASHSKLLPLNGDIIELGSGSDVVNHYASEQSFSLGASSNQESITWHFRHQKDLSARGLVQLVNVKYSGASSSKKSTSQILPIRISQSPLTQALRNVIFIGAGRDGQLETYPLPRTPSQQVGDVGANGQYGAYWYLECADDEVDPKRRHPTDDRETVRSQMDAWINELFPGARANADRLTVDSPVQLTFSLTKTSPWSKPVNVGFGLSYAFPMLVAVLTAKPGSIIVLDSAEAHLHPRAQSAVGRLLAQMAGAGLQIFLESHSDHLLNGIRLAVREELLRPQDAAVHFFGANRCAGSVTTLSLDRMGAISDWPDGFFDQTERDLASLSGWT